MTFNTKCVNISTTNKENHKEWYRKVTKKMKTMKLTTEQQRVYDELVKKVNEARECKDYDEYWSKYCGATQERWKASYEKYYISALDGIISIYRAKHQTLLKLEKLGLVKVIDVELNLIQLI